VPQMRKLTSAEITSLYYSDPGVRAELVAHYDALLAPFDVGDYGLAEPEMGETRLAVRRRLQAAAGRRGWMLAFVPTEGEGLVFQVRATG